MTTQTLATSGTFGENLQRTDFTSFSKRVDVSFASFVYPFHNFDIAAYYSEPLNYQAAGAVLPTVDPLTGAPINPPRTFVSRDAQKAVSEQQCLDLQANDPNSCLEFDVTPFVTAVNVNQRTWGLGGAWKIRSLSIGASARFQQFHETAGTIRPDSE